MPKTEFTADELETMFHSFLGAGDVQGVEAALTVMVGVDMPRAVRLYEELGTALAIVQVLRPSEEPGHAAD